jgi:predicted GIY-YIG superfamily endonuclease
MNIINQIKDKNFIKMNDEYFKLLKELEEDFFDDIIYISNYGDIYNKTQDTLYSYESSSVNLKVKNVLHNISRWNATVSIFNMANREYEENRKIKKIKYKTLKELELETETKIKTLKISKKNIIDLKPNIVSQLENNYFEKNKAYIEVLNLKNKMENELKELDNNKNKMEIELKELENAINKICIENAENKYNNTIIYIIRPKYNNFYMYVGHTTNKDVRLKQHIEKTNDSDTKLYKTIRETGGWNNWDMIEIDVFSCKNKQEALKREQDWCLKLCPNLNSISPFA